MSLDPPLFFISCSFCFTLEKPAQDQGPMTRLFASLKKAVDKMHFRGHRGGYCHKMCDPWKIKELDGVNTPVCEQVIILLMLTNFM